LNSILPIAKEQLGEAVPRLFKGGVSLLALAMLVSGCQQAKKPTAPTVTEEIFPVRVLAVQPANLQRSLDAIGTLRYRRETPLGFTTSGKVSRVSFEEGDYVKRGALLAALDTTNVGADLSVANAQREQAQSEFERIRSLYADGWVTKARYEAAETAVKSASARVRQTGFASGTAALYAPSNGVVLTRNVEPGQVIAVGSPALILGQDDQGFVFRAPIIDKDAAKLRVGMPAEVILESLSKAPFAATISEIDGRSNDATGAFVVQFRLAGRSGMRSGQIGKVTIAMPAADDGALQIPAVALFGIRSGEALVYVVDPATNRVETRNVVIERLADQFVLVSGGIQTGDLIVVSGREKLRTGARVNPVRQPG
jgi:RND family efflux transporter MFP subunit